MKSIDFHEFEANFDTYIDSEQPLAITKDGKTLGHFVPIRRREVQIIPTLSHRDDPRCEALRESHEALQREMARVGVTEEQIIEDFMELRREERRKRAEQG